MWLPPSLRACVPLDLPLTGPSSLLCAFICFRCGSFVLAPRRTSLSACASGPGPTIDVTTFGLIPDGATDNSPLIHKALQALFESPNGTLYFPCPLAHHCTYLFASAAPSQSAFIQIPMQAGNSYVVCSDDSPSSATISYNNVVATLLYASADEDAAPSTLSMHDITFSVFGGATNNVIRVQGPIDVTLGSNVQLTALLSNAGTGIVLDRVHSALLSGLVIGDVVDNGGFNPPLQLSNNTGPVIVEYVRFGSPTPFASAIVQQLPSPGGLQLNPCSYSGFARELTQIAENGNNIVQVFLIQQPGNSAEAGAAIAAH